MNSPEPGPNLRWQVGEIEIVRVEENITPVPPAHLVPGLGTDEVDGCRSWATPYVTGSGLLLLSVHTFVVRCGTHTVVVDTCAGVEPARPLPGDPSFLDRLAIELDGGLASVDTVLCTHLHFDHVGWNTVPDPTAATGRRPTFPEARYVFGRAELDDVDADVREPAIEPLLDAGLVDLIGADIDHVIVDDAHGSVRTTPTPGHTPGHVSVLVESRGERAIISGDVFHTPLQLAHPHTAASFDGDPEMARATRRALIDRIVDSDVLLLGTHFAPPTAGYVRTDADGGAYLG